MGHRAKHKKAKQYQIHIGAPPEKVTISFPCGKVHLNTKIARDFGMKSALERFGRALAEQRQRAYRKAKVKRKVIGVCLNSITFQTLFEEEP